MVIHPQLPNYKPLITLLTKTNTSTTAINFPLTLNMGHCVIPALEANRKTSAPNRKKIPHFRSISSKKLLVQLFVFLCNDGEAVVLPHGIFGLL